MHIGFGGLNCCPQFSPLQLPHYCHGLIVGLARFTSPLVIPWECTGSRRMTDIWRRTFPAKSSVGHPPATSPANYRGGRKDEPLLWYWSVMHSQYLTKETSFRFFFFVCFVFFCTCLIVQGPETWTSTPLSIHTSACKEKSLELAVLTLFLELAQLMTCQITLHG